MLVIVGDNFEDKAFQKVLSGCMHRDRIVFTGWKDSRGVLSELQKADSFVLASRVEAQSIAVLEAMSTGLPVVCTEVVPEAIVTPKEGYRVPVEDVVALADAMKTMIFNRDKFDGKAISAHVNLVSGPDVVTEQMISIYEKVLYTKK
jgi:Glycosyltransferase